MTRKLDNYYLNQSEPNKSCLLALRAIILDQDAQVTETVRIWNALLLLWEEDVLLFVDG
ncbi:MAG: hypothetical protein U5K54_23190 [Cytophagales bacterium]|nr:hypothetical protein [Cytophagales bacterium]